MLWHALWQLAYSDAAHWDVAEEFTLSLWEHASQEPPPLNPTTFPFGKELLKRDIDMAAAENSKHIPDEKGKGKAVVIDTIQENEWGRIAGGVKKRGTRYNDIAYIISEDWVDSIYLI
jgi:hypothetical protein